MTIQNMQFQQETRASIQSLTNQMGQMATQLNQAQSQNSNKLPSQTVQNLKNVSAITLRSGKQIEVPPPVAAPAPEPVKLHSTPEKEDELVAFMSVKGICVCSGLLRVQKAKQGVIAARSMLQRCS